MSQFWLEFWDSEAGNLSWGQKYDVDSIPRLSDQFDESQFWFNFWDSESGNLSWGQNYDVDSISQLWHPKAEMKSDAARHALFPDPRLHISGSGPQANLRPNSKSPCLRLLPPLSGLRTPGIPNYPEGQGSIRHPEPDPRPGTSDLWPLERFSDLRLQTEFKSQTWGSGVAATRRSQSSVSRCSQHNLKYVQKPDLGQEISTFQVTCGRHITSVTNQDMVTPPAISFSIRQSEFEMVLKLKL
ncbi:hypothetical protein ON010_g2812 [Phytophthora cinnamomi]|nr:hypothetical protein ON010_g2812 [Phytophthora cinnamomi]